MTRTEKKALLLQNVVTAQEDLKDAAVAYAVRPDSPEALRALLSAGRGYAAAAKLHEAVLAGRRI